MDRRRWEVCQQFSGPAMITFSVATEHLKSQVMIYRGRIRTLQQLYFILWNQKVYNTCIHTLCLCDLSICPCIHIDPSPGMEDEFPLNDISSFQGQNLSQTVQWGRLWLNAFPTRCFPSLLAKLALQLLGFMVYRTGSWAYKPTYNWGGTTIFHA